jgi:NitT/TauT family transport system permease protein
MSEVALAPRAGVPRRTLLRLRRFDWRGVVVPIALIVIAQIWAMAVNLQSDSLARPSDIVVALGQALLDGSLLKATYETLGSALGGLAIGGTIGLVFGVLLGVSRVFDQLMMFTVESIRPIPSAAVIPVALLIYGFGFRMEIAIVSFSATWPILIFTRSAVSGIEPRLTEVSRVLGLSFPARVWKIILPAALPRIFVAFRLAAAVALIVAVTVEVVANPLGLGYGMMVAQQSLHPELMFAFLVWVGVVGWCMNALLLWMQGALFGPAALAMHQ